MGRRHHLFLGAWTAPGAPDTSPQWGARSSPPCGVVSGAPVAVQTPKFDDFWAVQTPKFHDYTNTKLGLYLFPIPWAELLPGPGSRSTRGFLIHGLRAGWKSLIFLNFGGPQDQSNRCGSKPPHLLERFLAPPGPPKPNKIDDFWAVQTPKFHDYTNTKLGLYLFPVPAPRTRMDPGPGCTRDRPCTGTPATRVYHGPSYSRDLGRDPHLGF